MQLYFKDYFKFTAQWSYPVYWIAGQEDGIVDLNARFFALCQKSNLKIIRFQLKQAKAISELEQIAFSGDLFGEKQSLMIEVANSCVGSLISWLQEHEENLEYIIIYSPKLTPKDKKNPLFNSRRIGFYALWPPSLQQVSTWWQNACQRLKFKVSSKLSDATIHQNGYRIDRLKSCLDRWQLSYPGGGDVVATDLVELEGSQRFYDWARDWLCGKNTHQYVIAKEDITRFFLALRYYVDDLLTFDLLKRQGQTSAAISKSLKWWPKKADEMSAIYHALGHERLHQLAWQIIQLDLCRVGQLQYPFDTLFKLMIHDRAKFNQEMLCLN